jgi:hypothetical protein
MRRVIIRSIIALVCLLLIVFAFFIPIQARSGVIDSTANLCLDYASHNSNHYHILLGQLHDYNLVKKHLLPASTPCGQPVTFKLYL